MSVETDGESARPSSGYDIGDGERYSVAVVEAVADAADRDPLEFSEPLYSVVDPDVLDRLFPDVATSADGNQFVSFTYCGYRVTVRPGEVIVARTDADE